jgi:hypothetical protein
MKEYWKATALECDMQGLLQRIEKIETQYRRLKIISTVSLFFIAPLFVMGLTLPQTKEFEGTKFVLIDSTKKARAELAVNALDQPVLTFRDSSGKVRAELNINNNGKSELLLKSKEDSQFVKVSTDTSASSIELKNQATRTLVNSRNQTFYDNFNNPLTILGVNDSGQSQLTLQDARRSRGIDLMIQPNRSILELFTIINNRRSQAALEVEAVGGGNLKLFNHITEGYVVLHSRSSIREAPLPVNSPGLLIKRGSGPVFRAP